MLKINLILITLVVLFNTINTSTVEDLDDAKLLVVKNILNNYVVEGTDIVMKYSIYNIGNQAALNVQLKDDNFPETDFIYASGFKSVKWPKVMSGSNVTHVAIVKPKVTGLFNFTHAEVSYFPNDKADKPQIGHSTELGQAYIQNFKEYNRKYASHSIDWIFFVIMCSPSIAFPFFLWFNSKKKYENIKKDSKRETKKE